MDSILPFVKYPFMCYVHIMNIICIYVFTHTNVYCIRNVMCFVTKKKRKKKACIKMITNSIIRSQKKLKYAGMCVYLYIHNITYTYECVYLYKPFMRTLYFLLRKLLHNSKIDFWSTIFVGKRVFFSFSRKIT